MEAMTLSIFYLFFLFTHTTSNSNEDCAPSSCSPNEDQVHFPFQLTGRQPIHCGWPGFNLNCSSDDRTTLVLRSGDAPVKRISYTEQTITIDPQFCLPNKLKQFTLSGTAFDHPSLLTAYSFFNCSSHYSGLLYPFDCLSGPNYTVYAMPTDDYRMPPGCQNISRILMPVQRYFPVSADELELQWFMPDCRFCEEHGGICETSSNNPDDVVCHPGPSRGLTTSTKYGIFVGVGIPAFLCLYLWIHY